MRSVDPSASARPVRLLFFVTHGMSARILLRGQLGFLRQRGFEVAVAAAPGPDLEQVARREGVAIFPVDFTRRMTPLRDLMAVRQALSVVRAFDPQIVNAGTPKAALIGGIAAAWARVPLRFDTIRGLPLETAVGPRRALLRFSEKVAARVAHRVVCVSPSLRERVREEGICSGEKLTVLGAGSSNGVDVERFRPAREEEASELRELRRRLGIADHAPVVGFVGRLTSDKGIDDLVSVFVDRLEGLPEKPYLLLVGDFESEDPVAPLTRDRMARSERILVTGFVEDTAPYYRLMDLLAFPSAREGMPNVPLEASSSSLPVVAYSATGSVDAVADGQAGRLVDFGDREGLGRALQAYLEDASLRSAHGRAGRERVVELFRSELVWEAWIDEYRRRWRETRSCRAVAEKGRP